MAGLGEKRDGEAVNIINACFMLSSSLRVF